jgi:hypothetical protein
VSSTICKKLFLYQFVKQVNKNACSLNVDVNCSVAATVLNIYIFQWLCITGI